MLYTSRASHSLEADDIFRIVTVSARNNPARAVTGFLVFGNGNFVQLVEGPAMALDQLLVELRVDARHNGLEILDRASIAERSFPAWRMERLPMVDGDVAPLLTRLTQAGVEETAKTRAARCFDGDGARAAVRP